MSVRVHVRANWNVKCQAHKELIWDDKYFFPAALALGFMIYGSFGKNNDGVSCGGVLAAAY